MMRRSRAFAALSSSVSGNGTADRKTLVIIVIAALAAILFFSLYQRHGTDSGTLTSPQERGMSAGHRLLNQEAGRTLPANAPRIPRADALITRASGRFRMSKEQVSDVALTTHNLIARERPEDVLDVLDATLFATDGIAPEQVPAMAPVAAAYAKVRMSGGTVAAARDVARQFAQMAAQDSAHR
ncbi:hypothetical protein QLQ15_13055 [Lysobacter sp. LF1]|uniref:Uncharacterized protein n=1 Tax=Lysobacter stagni TaxID=3045172 RepID=A0ABT6XI51_9GAMM|nr:hypothetical protein [Lysobacter sp. LF1]MDI9239833.1 hypothetical protein [Lysobacter sp. LF1]